MKTKAIHFKMDNLSNHHRLKTKISLKPQIGNNQTGKQSTKLSKLKKIKRL